MNFKLPKLPTLKKQAKPELQTAHPNTLDTPSDQQKIVDKAPMTNPRQESELDKQKTFSNPDMMKAQEKVDDTREYMTSVINQPTPKSAFDVDKEFTSDNFPHRKLRSLSERPPPRRLMKSTATHATNASTELGSNQKLKSKESNNELPKDERKKNKQEKFKKPTGSIQGSVGTSLHTLSLESDKRSISERKRPGDSKNLVKQAQSVLEAKRELPAAFMKKFMEKNVTLDETITPEDSNVSAPTQEATYNPIQYNNEDRQSFCRKKWRLAILATLIGKRFVNLYYELRSHGIMSLPHAPSNDSEGIAFLLSSQPEKLDAAFTSKVVELTSKVDRSDQDVEALERILTIRIKALTRFTVDQRLKFCKILKYEKHLGERLIVREGHVSWAFYFIMSGQVEIFKVKNGMKYRLNVMNAGASFGDRTMNLLNDKRTACVASTRDVELIRIDKSDFFDITNVKDEKGMANRSAKMLQIPHFAAAPGGFIERLVPFVQLITFEPNETIILEGTFNYKVFWIIKGSCRCFKVVPFIRRLTSSNYAGKTFKTLAYDPNTPVSPDDEIYKENLALHELEPGDNFPELPLPKDVRTDDDLMYLDRKDYIEQLKKEDPTDFSAKAYVSIIAKTKVEVAVVPRVDYIQLATVEMILEIINSKSIFRVPMIQLQESYLEKKNWQNYKKKVVGEITKK